MKLTAYKLFTREELTASQAVGMTFRYFTLLIFVKVAMLVLSPENDTTPANAEVIDEIMRERGLVFLFIAVVFAGPFVEEILFRGALYNAVRWPIEFLTRRISCNEWLAAAVAFFVAALASAYAFAWAHQETSATMFLLQAVTGVFAAHLYFKTRTLWAPVGMHMLNNAIPMTAMLLL